MAGGDAEQQKMMWRCAPVVDITQLDDVATVRLDLLAVGVEPGCGRRAVGGQSLGEEISFQLEPFFTDFVSRITAAQ